MRLWNIFFASVKSQPSHCMFEIKCISRCTPRTPTPSLSNYLCLSELELSRDSSDNREALLHYGEVSRGFCVVRQEGGWHLSCEWDHWVGGNFGPRWRALVREAFLLTCLFPQLSLLCSPIFFNPNPQSPPSSHAVSAFLPNSSLHRCAHDDMCVRAWQPRPLFTLYLREPTHLAIDKQQCHTTHFSGFISHQSKPDKWIDTCRTFTFIIIGNGCACWEFL